MLDTHPYETPAPHKVDGNGTSDHMLQIVTEARLRRLAATESLAGLGTFEIYLGPDRTETSCYWSPGIYALLSRAQSAGPLTRTEYVRCYVATEDQQRILVASKAAFTGDHNANLQYRIVTGNGATLDVSEELSLIASTTTEHLVCGELSCTNAPTVFSSKPADPVLLSTMRAMIATFDAVKDGEQHRLQREMHDEFGQLLSAMKLDLLLLQKELPQRSTGVERQMDSLHELIDTMIVSVRRIVAELPPQSIAELGFEAALCHLVRGFRKRYPIKFIVSCTLKIDTPNAFLAEPAYRIIQETLSNIVRHAHADCVHIDVFQQAGQFRLQIEDNGNGITLADQKKTGSFGIVWMRERVTALEGTITIRGRPGEGTVIDIRIPTKPATG